MIVAIVGVGLIGGSLAIALKEKGIAHKIIGVDSSEQHLQKAMDLGLIDEKASLDDAVQAADFTILSLPVDAMESLLPAVLSKVGTGVVMDVGSIKEAIINSVGNHPKRTRFVARGTIP